MGRLSIPKSYKPEIENCPICGGKLKYRYAVSNKVIQFSHGEKRRIKNLGYSCTNPMCPHKELIYISQTASKLCVKGYTYSAKILFEIMCYKQIHKSREEIVDLLSKDNIEISDRNVDVIFNKLEPLLLMDYKENIKSKYEYMMKEYGQIALSMDFIRLSEDYRVISVKSFFDSSYIGIHIIKGDGINDYNILDDYLNKDLKISYIFTVRNIFRTYDEIKKRVNENTKIVSYIKI